MKPNFTFNSENLTFTPICLEDAEIIVKWRGNKQNVKFLKNNNTITVQEHLYWFNNVYLTSPLCLHFIVSTTCANNKIGTVSANFTNEDYSTCYVGYGIFEENEQRKGYGKESLLALIDMIVNKYKCLYFVAEIHQHNLSSINLAIKCGFKQETTQNNFITFVLNYDDKNIF